MKEPTRMKTFESSRRLVPVAILFLAMATSILIAQPPDKSAGSQRADQFRVQGSGQQAYHLEVKDGVLVRGGSNQTNVPASLANVIDAVRDRYPEANIVIAPGLANMSISDLKLRTGNISEELEAIRVASGGKFECSGGPGNVVVDPTTGLPTGSGSNNKGLFT